jgi:hypothetical protein
MKEKIEKFLKLKKDLTSELKKWVKDKSIPLEERWDVFVDSELWENDCYIIHSDVLDLDRCYSNMDRHETINVEWILEYFSDEPKEKLDKFKEEILENFIYSFTYDW